MSCCVQRRTWRKQTSASSAQVLVSARQPVSDAAILADALNAAHAGVPDLVASANAMAARVRRLAAEKLPGPATDTSA